jgi:hypothetical protein
MITKILCGALLLGVAASLAAAQAPKSTPTDKKDQCSISGMVVALAGSQPLRKARVRLASLDDRTRTIGFTTDASGRFELRALDPGRYNLSVSRAGYVGYNYGEHKPGDPGAVLTLRPGQEVNDLVFRMIPSAVIAGRILDEDGEPMQWIQVSAMQETYAKGKRSLGTSTQVETDDLGQYRLFGLAPGKYFISAVSNAWRRYGGQNDAEDAQPSSEAYAKMYYPGTPDVTKAIAIAVKAGEEIPSVEMLMRPVPVVHVRGRVINLITHKNSSSVVLLVPRTTSQEWSVGELQASIKPDGSFDVGEVAPGSYTLLAASFEEGRFLIARTSVDVSNADMEGLSLTIGAIANVNGRIIWEGQPSVEKDELMVTPRPKDLPMGFGNYAHVNPNNSFSLKDLSEGSYTFEVSGQSKDCYIKQAQYSGSDALTDGFTVLVSAPGSLEITISTHGGRVQGAVVDEDGLPASGVYVALVPDAEHRQPRLYKTGTTDQYGHFDLRGIAPGDYRLYSWDEVEDGAWEDPEFMKPFEDKGQGEKVSVQEGDTKSVNLVAIKTAGTEEQKASAP